MPLAVKEHTGDTTLTDIVAAVSGVAWRVLGLAVTATGAGTVIIKNGTTVVAEFVSPCSISLAPNDAWEFPATNAVNTSISLTNSASGVDSSVICNYMKVPS